MVDLDNKLSKANKLNVSGNRVDSLGATDLEDLHRFTLDKRSQVTLSLSKVGKGAKVRTELYALTGSLNKRLKKTDFNKLGAKDLQGVLRRVSVSELGDLAAGEYYIRVLGGKGKSRYRLKLSAAPIVDPLVIFPPVVIGVTPPVVTPVTPPVVTGVTPPVVTPVTPPVVTPVEAPKAQISRQPNDPIYTVTLDFSQNQDIDPAEDKGRFVRGIAGSITSSGTGTQSIFQASDLVSFVNSDGQVEYRSQLLNISEIDSPFRSALFVKFILPASYRADADSLSFLQNAFNEVAFDVNEEFEDGGGGELKADVYFDYGLGTQNTDFDEVRFEVQFANSDPFIDGGPDNDYLFGSLGNDYLYGGDGNDTLYGVDSTVDTSEFVFTESQSYDEQFDYLTGGNGADYFVLGNPGGVFYTGNGYARIQDWDPISDFIETKGDASQYRLEFRNVVGSTALDTEIYYANGAIDDRIAIVKDTTNVIFSRDFRFI